MKSTRESPIEVGDVTINPTDRLDIVVVTPEIQAAIERRVVVLTDATLTEAEHRADLEAIKPFRTGDPAIDG
jgi:hypothetical protein